VQIPGAIKTADSTALESTKKKGGMLVVKFPDFTTQGHFQ